MESECISAFAPLSFEILFSFFLRPISRPWLKQIFSSLAKKVWVYFLKKKSDVFVTFKQWKALVEKQTGKKIKRLRTSNGLEFFDGDFNKFCKDEGIVRHLTVRGTPQQNGVAERMN